MNRLQRIEYLSSWDDIDPESDNVDVHIYLDDGSVYSLLVATPKNIYWCMENEGIDYFFGTPPVFVARLDKAHVERAIEALISTDDGRWLHTYGVLQIGS
jgi:uncharacterized membrane protein YpjA